MEPQPIIVTIRDNGDLGCSHISGVPQVQGLGPPKVYGIYLGDVQQYLGVYRQKQACIGGYTYRDVQS